MSEKALFTVGVFAGIIDSSSGRLLLRRRIEEGSILPGQSFRGNWELPGGGVMDAEKVSYTYLSKELEREVAEELGVSIPVDLMPSFYPAPFKGPKGYDLALVTPIIIPSPLVPEKIEVTWVSPGELEQLAREFVAPDKKTGTDGKGLLSGYGKRMHCLALAALCHSPSPDYAAQARRALAEIQKAW